MIGVCFLKQLVKHCSKSWTRPDMAPPGGLKVGPRPDLAQWTRCHCSTPSTVAVTDLTVYRIKPNRVSKSRCLSVCLSVCLSQIRFVLKRLEGASWFWRGLDFFSPIPHSVVRKFWVSPSGILFQALDLENFATTGRSCCQQNPSTVELVDHTYDGRRCG